MQRDLIRHLLAPRGLPVLHAVRLGATNKLSVKHSPASTFVAQSNVALFATRVRPRKIFPLKTTIFLQVFPNLNIAAQFQAHVASTFVLALETTPHVFRRRSFGKCLTLLFLTTSADTVSSPLDDCRVESLLF